MTDSELSDRLSVRIVTSGSSRPDADLVEEGCVVAACAVAAAERDGVSPRRDVERHGRVRAVSRVSRPEGLDDDPVDQDVEVLGFRPSGDCPVGRP